MPNSFGKFTFLMLYWKIITLPQTLECALPGRVTTQACSADVYNYGNKRKE